MVSDLKLSISSEMMQAFQPGDIMKPHTDFQAIQSTNGLALLFSISTDNQFYLTAQKQKHATGWHRINLLEILAETFDLKEVKASHFAVNELNGKIDIALGLLVEGNAQLYVSRGHTQIDSIIEGASWSPQPFDDPEHLDAVLRFEQLYVSQRYGQSYVAADVLHDDDEVVKRYYIDEYKKAGQAWNRLVLGIDLEKGLQSTLGRLSRQPIDGMFILGKNGQETELIYTQLQNWFDPKYGAPDVTPLKAPEGATALAACPNHNDADATHLFVAAEGFLYFYPSDTAGIGNERPSGLLVHEHPLFNQVSRLFAFTHQGHYVVWGLNVSKEIFYLKVAADKVTSPESWSYPVVIARGVKQVTPFVNKKDGGNTFFAHIGTSELLMSVQSGENHTWKNHKILLEAPDGQTPPTQNFAAWHTRIQMSSEENPQLEGVEVALTSTNRCQVLINNVAYVLSDEPLLVKPDVTGGITIIEKTESLAGAVIQYTVEGQAPVSFDPTAGPLDKIYELNTTDGLKGAQIKYNNINKDQFPDKHLILNTTKAEDQQAVVDSLKQMQEASRQVPQDGSKLTHSEDFTTAAKRIHQDHVVAFFQNHHATVASQITLEGEFFSIGGAIEALAGDVFRFAKHTVEDIVSIVAKVERGIWHMVIQIGETVFQVALDSLEVIAQAIEVVFKAIDTLVKDLIDFIRFLFDIEAFMRTRDVMNRIINLGMMTATSNIDLIKKDVDDFLEKLKKKDEAWAGLNASDDWSDEVAESNHHLGWFMAFADLTKILTGPGMFFFNTVINNIVQVKVPDISALTDQQFNEIKNPLNTLFEAFTDTGSILFHALVELKRELLDDFKFMHMSLSEIIKKIIGIAVETGIDLAENYLDAILEIFKSLSLLALEGLNAEVYFPIITDVLKWFGVKDGLSFSLLDVFCLVGAVPANLAYVISKKGPEPFPKDDELYLKIMGAHSPQELEHAFKPVVSRGLEDNIKEYVFSKIHLTQEWQDTLLVVGKTLAGVVNLASIPLIVMADEELVDSEDIETATGIAVGVAWASNWVASLFITEVPIDNNFFKKMATWLGRISEASWVIFKVAPEAMKKYKKLEDEKEIEQMTNKVQVVGDGVSASLSLLGFIPTAWHLYELSQKSGEGVTYTIFTETTNITGGLAKASGFITKLDPDPDTKTLLTAAIVGLKVSTGVILIGEGVYKALHMDEDG